jgi:protein-S-isoprenylcysteine O-methyltransferase Ste14
MRPLWFTNSSCATVFWAACGVLLLSELAIFMRERSGTDAIVRDQRSLTVVRTAGYLGVGLSFWLGLRMPQSAIRVQRSLLFGSGAALMILGTALRWAAILTLGRAFRQRVAVQPDQQVIQSGPYRLVRHPAYTGRLLQLVGLALTMTNWASLAASIACFVGGWTYRIRVEEQVLGEELGQPYRDYMRRTKRLIPGVV